MKVLQLQKLLVKKTVKNFQLQSLVMKVLQLQKLLVKKTVKMFQSLVVIMLHILVLLIGIILKRMSALMYVVPMVKKDGVIITVWPVKMVQIAKVVM